MRAWSCAAAAAATATVAMVALAGCTEPTNLQFIPAEENFGLLPVGTPSSPRQLILTNSGPGSTGTLQTDATGDVGDFALQENTCAGQVLLSGTNCQVKAIFNPTVAGPRQVTLSISSGDSAASAAFRGAGAAPAQLVLSPARDPYDYGPVVAGGTGKTALFQVTNQGDLAGPLLSVSLSGADASMFAVEEDQCSGQPVPPVTRCTFSVAFRPPLSATGVYSASVQVGGGLAFGVVGNAIHVASLDWMAGAYDYGIRQVTVDSASGDFTFQLSNLGNLDTSAVTLSTTGDPDFQLRSSTCGTSGAFTLSPGASCSITVRFVAQAGGDRAGSLVASAAQGGGASGVALPLYGEGQWLLQVSKAGTAPGTVVSAPAGINCDPANTDCSQLYRQGTMVTLTASAAANAHLTGWTGCVPVSGRPQDCVATMDGTGATGGVQGVVATFDF